ncbi:carbamoyltransferase C-terminal domain-containing protein [Nonomuraea sp. B5E05]|uniref:carbamoyltransferase family protein n=1 Tax=Nonomuraea sp. B5E05 TaxID=3153569 RepID=UPI0032605FB6
MTCAAGPGWRGLEKQAHANCFPRYDRAFLTRRERKRPHVIILGTKPIQHDACFALIKDGEPLFIYEQERFNRVKHGMSSTLSTLFEALDEHAVKPGDIDLVTNCIDPARLDEVKDQTRTYMTQQAVDQTAAYLDWRLPTWHQSLISAGFPAERVVSIRHHVCHAAGVYYASPYRDAAILSVDGSGETETAMLVHGSGQDLEVLRTTPHPQSLGLLYQAATYWLGWGFGEEGKTMALAGYGDPERHREQLDTFVLIGEDGDFSYAPAAALSNSRYTPVEMAQDVFAACFGPARRSREPLTQLHKDVAAAVQAVCEDIMLKSARHLRERTGSRTLLLTGGVALNSVSNGRIMRSGLFDEVVVYPQANDSGTALGGALYAYHQLAGRRRGSWHMEHPYWGKPIDTDNVERAAATFGQRGRRMDDVVEAAADLLAEGRTLGWVQGRSEVGPRSLGNRSVLGNPLVDGIKQRINDGIKHRENWRPFAPSVLREDLSTYFEADQDLPYMTVVAPIREEWRDRLASVGHVDGTARVQTVTERSNPRFYALLKAFKARTGVGVLLNTSFNDRGEPLVQTCEQALRLFTTSEMDALAIGDWLFSDKQPAGTAAPFAPWLDNFAKLPDNRLLLVDGDPPLPEAMRAHLLALRPKLAIVDAGQSDIDDLCMGYDAVVRYIDRTADTFVFDRALYYSDTAETARRIMREAGLPVYWIDSRGDVVPARDVLYIRHDRADTPVPSSYERYWAGDR